MLGFPGSHIAHCRVIAVTVVVKLPFSARLTAFDLIGPGRVIAACWVRLPLSPKYVIIL